MNRTQRVYKDSETTFDDTIVVDTSHYTFVQNYRITTPRVNSTVNYGLWIMISCDHQLQKMHHSGGRW